METANFLMPATAHAGRTRFGLSQQFLKTLEITCGYRFPARGTGTSSCLPKQNLIIRQQGFN